MTYKKYLVPDQKNHSIEIPEAFFGKNIEVIVMELENPKKALHPPPPEGKKIAVDELFEIFGACPDFPSIEEIRKKAWPSKW